VIIALAIAIMPLTIVGLILAWPVSVKDKPKTKNENIPNR
jgi:energy-converting hydrogenase Eha subunit A